MLNSTITGRKKEFYSNEFKTQVTQYTWLWKLENFKDIGVNKETTKYRPPIPLSITAPNKMVEFWNLELQFQGHPPSAAHFSFLIWRDERAQRDLEPDIAIFILDRAMTKIYTVPSKEFTIPLNVNTIFTPFEYLASTVTFGMIFNSLAALLDDGSLSILVEFTFPVQAQSTYVIPTAGTQLFGDFLKYLNTDKFSDFVLEVKGVELKAHKILLAAKSPVFATMFDQDGMTENTGNRVKIDDIEPEVAKQMLEFIYTDRAPSRIYEFAGQLIAAAHKYQMEKLSMVCEGTLIEKITHDNAVENLIFADTYDLKHLKKGVYEFFKKDKSLLEAEEFDELERDHPELTFELYREIMSVRRQRTDPGPSQEN